MVAQTWRTVGEELVVEGGGVVNRSVMVVVVGVEVSGVPPRRFELLALHLHVDEVHAA